MGRHFWPDDAPEGFFETLGTTLEEELERYDAVIFFESAAVGDISIEGGNPARTESNEEGPAPGHPPSGALVEAPNFHFVPHSTSFFAKLQDGLEQLQDDRRRQRPGCTPTHKMARITHLY